jgi:molybdopterin adenylyltransferase
MDNADPPTSIMEHRAQAPDVIRLAVLTVSDTRDESSDSSGSLIREALASAGHVVAASGVVRDEPRAIVDRVQEWAWREDIDGIIATGGTGIAPRDRTPEAMSSVFERSLDGFGELFRMLSFQEIGSAAMLSRATAGIVNGKPVFALPGSRNAVRLAMEQLIIPEIGHIVFESRKGRNNQGSDS